MQRQAGDGIETPQLYDNRCFAVLRRHLKINAVNQQRRRQPEYAGTLESPAKDSLAEEKDSNDAKST